MAQTNKVKLQPKQTPTDNKGKLQITLVVYSGFQSPVPKAVISVFIFWFPEFQ